MLYEIISPDAFLRPYIDGYTGLASMYAVVAKAYTKQVYVDKAFQFIVQPLAVESSHK